MIITYTHCAIPSLRELDNGRTTGSAPVDALEILQIVYPPIVEQKHSLQLSNYVTVVALKAEKEEDNLKFDLVFCLADKYLDEEDNVGYTGHALPYGPQDPVFIGISLIEE